MGLLVYAIAEDNPLVIKETRRYHSMLGERGLANDYGRLAPGGGPITMQSDSHKFIKVNSKTLSWFMAHGYSWYVGLGFAHGLHRNNLMAHDNLGLSGLDVAHSHLIKIRKL